VGNGGRGEVAKPSTGGGRGGVVCHKYTSVLF
jgi:hypothetical protein